MSAEHEGAAHSGSEGLTVIVPTLMEAEAIGLVLDELLQHGYKDVIVVDGGSTDGTREIAASKGVRVCIQPGKGKADAVRYGIELASAELVAVMDGDYTYPAYELHKLYEQALQGYDLVIGKRVPEPGAQPAAFRLGNKLLTTFFNILFGTHLTDVLSGMYVVRKSALANALFEMKGFSVESEIAAHIAATTGRIAEVPIRYRRRIGRKKLGKLAGVRIAVDMLRLAWRYNPLLLITGTAALMLVPGLALAAWVGYRYLFLGVSHFVWGIIAIVLTAVGFVALLLAMLAIYLKHMELRITRTIQALRDQLASSQRAANRAGAQPESPEPAERAQARGSAPREEYRA